ncbi:Mn-containing catalase [Amycolatopsis jiangsuensis]|uniref:Mn-containing catalase n=1 Tax=Amycolatopsis jiangsuensis TaxID=1181879 RepID=A0A840INN2_9PSEU|nr:Mn-containing catalase [Amycolatopsis jiangsuensis]
MTDDPGVKEMLKFNLARDTVHQKQWLAAIEELKADGLESDIAPTALFDVENQEHNNDVWHLSDGSGGPGTAPKPDPDLYGTYAAGQNSRVTAKGKAKSVKNKLS